MRVDRSSGYNMSAKSGVYIGKLVLGDASVVTISTATDGDALVEIKQMQKYKVHCRPKVLASELSTCSDRYGALNWIRALPHVVVV